MGEKDLLNTNVNTKNALAGVRELLETISNSNSNSFLQF